jgi:hypothetical protein
VTTPTHAFKPSDVDSSDLGAAGSWCAQWVASGEDFCGLPADRHATAAQIALSTVRVVAVDPGPVPGVAVITNDGGRLSTSVFQCDPKSVLWLVQKLIIAGPVAARRIIAVERFVVGMRAVRSSSPAAGAVTRDMIGALTELSRGLSRVSLVRRCAAEVMPWATDKRLKVVGLYDVTKAMPHARAASRHGLFAAVRDGNIPDPLSSKVRA